MPVRKLFNQTISVLNYGRWGILVVAVAAMLSALLDLPAQSCQKSAWQAGWCGTGVGISWPVMDGYPCEGSITLSGGLAGEPPLREGWIPAQAGMTVQGRNVGSPAPEYGRKLNPPPGNAVGMAGDFDRASGWG